MRTRTRTVQIPGTHTVNGQTMPVTITEQVTVPVQPRDWDAVALRAVTSLVLLLTLISVVWSTASIAALLGGGPIAVLAALVFDAAWIAALGMAYIVRHRPDRRAVVDRLGWALLAVTVTAIGVEGWHTGGLATAVPGAAVSLIAKGLWWALDRATRAPLSDLDRQWLAARLSQLAAQRATAAMQRQVAREQERIGTVVPTAGPDPDRPRGSTRPVARSTRQVDSAPALESTPAPSAPEVQADHEPAPEQVDPAPRSTPGRPDRGRPDLHAVPDQVDPADLDQARTIVAQLRADAIAPSTEQIRRRMGIGRDRARALWLAIQAEEATKARRTA